MNNIAVVAHDAGAANHIVAWLKSGHLNENNIFLCLDGPAINAYEKSIGDFDNYLLGDVINKIDLLISGTGWSSALEHQARKLASQKYIKTIAVIDHWTNYKERFSRDDEEVLADEVWVVDEYAEALALEAFPGTVVSLQPNDFITEQKREIESFIDPNSSFANRVLFVMEPIRQNWVGSGFLSELKALEYFIENRQCLSLEGGLDLIVKPHPSDPEGKYDDWVKHSNNKGIKIDSSSSLAELIAWADIVVGCQTYAMVVALSAGKKVVSSLPPIAPQCVLPHENIIHLRKLVQ